ncbi:MAG TPA: alpha-glucosidase [Steroidobacteraceae bacterium]|nr:alpha-glucosidase [Steroidobacteraceae bacterium]
MIYEIYPRSFQDSNGDGVGDLNGITQRLGYLEALGVDAIWIAPFFPSPQVDFGYDICDYQNVDPQFGTLADFDRLLAEAHKRHIRVVIDMVLNHTSDQHPWFIEAMRSRHSEAHDFYIWSTGRPDGSGRPRPPNNWVSLFGGSAWEYVPALGEFYYHLFYRQQPDLNWRNPRLERAMFDVMRFWLDRGVDGFRLDAVGALYEDPRLRDAPVLKGRNWQGDPNLSDIRTNNLPEVHALLRRLRAMLDHYPGDRVLIGETYVSNTAQLNAWYGGARHDELQLPMDTAFGFLPRLDAREFRRHMTEAATQLQGSDPLLVFDNHDHVRSWDRYGDGVHNLQIAKVVATLLLTSPGAALLYQGEEIGQATATPARVEDVRDPIGITGWPKEKGRDGERTPMQWDTSNAQAGFTSSSHPWLPVGAGYEKANVKTELADDESLLNWHKTLLALRRGDPALRTGRLAMLDAGNAHVLTYARVTPEGSGIIVSLNMSAQSQTVTINAGAAGLAGYRFRTLLSSPRELRIAGPGGRLTLPAYGAWVAAVE